MTQFAGPFDRLAAYDDASESYNVIVETPRGSRNKYTYEAENGLFGLSGVLPAGAVFPFDFGFIPRTLGEDGDPLDVLVLLDDTAFVGCRVSCRLVGVIQAEQTERDGETVRNDRLIAVATRSHNHEEVRDLEQVSESLLREIEHFFESYNEIKGKRFRPIGREGAGRAEEIVRQGMRAHQEAEGR